MTMPAYSPRLMAGLTAFLAALLLLGCTERQTEVAKDEPGPVPSATQRPGDPEEGYDILVNGGYVTCGIPYAALSRTARP